MMRNQIRRAAVHASALVAGMVLILIVLGTLSARVLADDPQQYSFVSAATFFSQAAQIERAIDPQVFIYDAGVAVGTGPQRVEHIAGLRNARLADVQSAPLYNAEGMSLGLTLRKWLAARGTLEVQMLPNGRERVIANFKHLVPFGTYTIFVERFRTDGALMTARPLDSDGSLSSFEAHVDGSAMFVLERVPLVHDGSIVLVYHSDDKEHGASRGRLGVTAHDQLIVRL
jgi:hypothetical protein